MLERFRTYLDRPSSVYLLIASYVIAAILQGLAFGVLIWFLRGFLSSDPASAAPALWLLIGLGGASVVVFAGAMVAAIRISAYDICGNVIVKIGARVSALPLGWFDAGAAGRVSAAVSRETDVLSHLASMVLPQVIAALVTPATAVIVTLIYDWQLGLVMVVTALIVWWLWRWAMALLHREQQESPRVGAETAGRILEQAKLQPVLRAQGVAGSQWAPLNEALQAEHSAIRSLMVAQSRPAAAFAVLAQASFAVVLGTGLMLLLGGQLDVAGYLAVALLAARFTTPISQSVLYASELQKAVISLDAIGTIISAPTLPEPAEPRRPEDTTIAFHDVSFGYHQDQPVLAGLNLEAPKGQITALVGPSGCGKSTLTRLAARFWDVTGGAVTIGGVDVREIATTQLMAMTAMVFQEVYLFDATVAENVRIGRPDATPEEVAQAISRAGLDETLTRLPQGSDTPVGEGGQRLSGGERQRVAIARAFLKDAPILLLDEITSALDAENEAAITATLAQLVQGRTVIVIAHRLSTVMNADQVYVLAGRNHGAPTKVIEHGPPQQLLAAGGAFASMVADLEASSRWELR